MKRFVFIAVCFFFFSPIQAHASNLYAGTGQASSTTPNISSMAQAAATEAKNAYNASGGTASPPKVIIVMENTGDGSGALTTAIRNVFGSTVPIVGTQEGWSDYTPYTIKEIPQLNTQLTMSILALGGDAISSVNYATGVGNFNANDNTQAQIGGQNLASKLAPVSGKNNLFLIMGPIHTPLNEYVIAGMKQVYGSPLPSTVKMMGWAGSYWGGSAIDNGVVKGNQIMGIQLVGDFKWAFSGIDHGNFGWNGAGPEAGDPVIAIANQYQKITTELGTIPKVSFMVIAHPDRSLFPAIRNSIATKIGTNAMIGMHGGSETGHDSTTSDVVAAGSHFFLAGLTGGGTGPSPITSAVPAPCVGDINGDKFVDVSDYSLFVQNFFKSPPSNPKADINADGMVDVSDYGLLVRNFFKSCP